MARPSGHIHLHLAFYPLSRLLPPEAAAHPGWLFVKDVWQLISAFRWYSLAICVVTVFQEFAALWPVTLLGQFIDRLGTGDLGNTVWQLVAASLFAPAIVRANVMLRHKMFYETDFQKMVQMVFKAADETRPADTAAAGAAYARTVNAVSGITNATYHMLGSFTPVIIKITIVSGNLLGYNRFLGIVYLLSLIIPVIVTVLFNRWLRVLLDKQYSIVSDVQGVGIRAIYERENHELRDHYLDILHTRKKVLQMLIYKGQIFTYLREAILVGSQFLVVFIALSMREQIGMTPGDFARVIGYTAQVAGAFINAAVCLDAIISYSRAYKVYASAGA
jgi:hypothetical protein